MPCNKFTTNRGKRNLGLIRPAGRWHK